MKVPAEELGWSLTLGREGLSGLPHHKKPARNAFAEAGRIIHHVQWQHRIQWFCRQMELPQGSERWVIVRTAASQQRVQASLQRQVSRAQTSWERKCWHLGTRRFACEADAREALERELKGKPTWVEIHSDFVAHPRHAGKGRPRKDASPATHQWQIVATVTINQPRVDEEALRKACFIVGTNELQREALSDQ